jgi:hypothetical protein
VQQVGLKPSEALARAHVIQTIHNVINQHNPAISIEAFGSFCTGLSFSSSDVDIVLVPSGCPRHPSVSELPTASCSVPSTSESLSCGDDSVELVDVLSQGLCRSTALVEIESFISHANSSSNSERDAKPGSSASSDARVNPAISQSLFLDPSLPARAFEFSDIPAILQTCSRIHHIRYINTARIPVIKVKVTHDVPGVNMISVDISCAVNDSVATSKSCLRHSGIRVREFTKLALRDYPCIKPLITVIKLALFNRGLSDPYRGGLGSYPLFIIIYYWTRFRCRSCEKSMFEEEIEKAPLGKILLEFLKWAATMFPWESLALDWESGSQSDAPLGHFSPITLPRADVQVPRPPFSATIVVMDPLNPGSNVASVSCPCYVTF